MSSRYTFPKGLGSALSFMFTCQGLEYEEGKTMDELLEKFEQLTEENKAMILAWLDEIIANQVENPEAPGSPGKADSPEP